MTERGRSIEGHRPGAGQVPRPLSDYEVVGGGEGGTKHDEGKPRWELLPVKAIKESVKVLTHAAEHKYSEHNWRKGIEQSRLLGAAMRHVTAYLDGEDNDPDPKGGGYCHLANAICALSFALENHLDGRTELDDRHTKEDR